EGDGRPAAPRPPPLEAPRVSWESEAAERISTAIRDAAATRGRCSVALSGGSTPRAIHPLLRDLPWPKLDFFFGDERCVSPDDPESNFRMAKETLFGSHPESRVHRMEAERPDFDRAAEEYARLLPESIDVLLLGMGP